MSCHLELTLTGMEWPVPKDKGYENNVHLDLHIPQLRVKAKCLYWKCVQKCGAQSSSHLVIPALCTPPQLHTETEENLHATKPKEVSVSEVSVSVRLLAHKSKSHIPPSLWSLLLNKVSTYKAASSLKEKRQARMMIDLAT